jgi:hypothetical protein
MSDERWHRLRALFDQVQEMSEADRKALLDRELAGQPELRAELDSLLADSVSAAGFLADRDRFGLTWTRASSRERPTSTNWSSPRGTAETYARSWPR